MGRMVKMLQVRRPAFTVLAMLSWNEADRQLVYMSLQDIIFLRDSPCIHYFLFPFFKHCELSKGL